MLRMQRSALCVWNTDFQAVLMERTEVSAAFRRISICWSNLYDVLLAVFYEIKVRRLKLTQIARNVRYFSCSTDPGCCF